MVSLYFSNYADQRLYRLNPGATEPQPLTPEGPFRYADGVIDRRRSAWVGVREDHTVPGHEPANTIVRVDARGACVLLSGRDFYSSPRLSPDCRWLAWLAWDHPRMPWVGTTLCVVRLDDDGMPAGTPIVIAGGEQESVFQPEWAPDGSELFFVSDRTGWWNLYRCALESQALDAVAPMEAEFGVPQWVFGMSTYAFAGPGRCGLLLRLEGTCATRHHRPAFRPAHSSSTCRIPISLPCRQKATALSSAPVLPRCPRVSFYWTWAPVRPRRSGNPLTVGDDPAIARYFTGVETIEFPATENRTAFGLYYPAFNPDYQAPQGENPPLLVKCHGGPTASASSTLDLRIQYWTSRGISVLDVNYGGSSGFGRDYRNRLDGNWGLVDVDDCVSGALYLAERGLVDGQRSVSTGGSAGGYTTLAALTFRDYFRGGASYYGVSDLAVLARDTHKFESRYLDSLVGPYPEREDLYRDRSPIAHVERLSVPVIFFQGDEDMVVPPNQAGMMVEALRRNGIPVAYLLYSGEQHGFRKAENIKRSLDAELYFYAANVFHCSLAF